MSDALSISRKSTKKRFARRNRLKAAGRKRRWVFCETPFGREVTSKIFFKQLAAYLGGNAVDKAGNQEKPNDPPDDLGDLIRQLDPDYLALAAISPILNGIFSNWDTAGGKIYDEVRLCEAIGEELRARLVLKKLLASDDKATSKIAKDVLDGKPKVRWARERLKFHDCEWTPKHCVKAGWWLKEAVLDLGFITTDKDGFLKIPRKYLAKIDELREEMIWRDPVHLPLTTPPPDWCGWNTHYDDRLEATFVRGPRAEKQGIMGAFASGDFAHAEGVNRLQQIPYTIDQQMLGLADRYAVRMLNEKNTRHLKDAQKTRQKKSNRDLVKDDIATAKVLSKFQRFWVPYNCDWRGRLYAIPNFNYGRADYVRSLFRFAKGEPLGPLGLEALEMHTAKCGGFEGINKKGFSERIEWSRDKKNRKMIQDIADDPIRTFRRWKDADEPLVFVSACIELSRALLDPDNFRTTLPIAFDGTANGLQHLSLMARDRDAMTLVNLIKSDRRQDIYSVIAKRVAVLLKDADAEPLAEWWLGCFGLLDEKQIRKLVKAPIMTVPYGITDPGMVRQLVETYRTELRMNSWPPDKAWGYLAEKIQAAAAELLPGPVEIMDYVRQLAAHCTSEGRLLEWTNGTNFPVTNDYREINLKPVYLYRPGFEVRLTVGDGYTDKIDKQAESSAAANFIHSWDAAHAIRVLIAAAKENIAVIPIHDSFSCSAPHAHRLHRVILQELALMYDQHDPLAELRSRNVDGEEILPLPPRDDVDLIDVVNADDAFSG